ncbi:hypothetical protein ACJJTC_018249 [Scirpophaga incertulas]
MKSGISKESLDKLCTKYPVPDNFKGVIPPKMNPEIAASLSSITIKRDQRLINRQNITGKLLTAISNTMTNVMKGNINSKIIIEQLSDAAKLAAQTFYEDNSSRNFFALANTSLTIKNALRDSEPELYLFGTDCGEKIKSAQTIQRTGNILKNKNTNNKPSTSSTKQGNWKSPLQAYQPYYQQSRSGPYRRQPPGRSRTGPTYRNKTNQQKPVPQMKNRR